MKNENLRLVAAELAAAKIKHPRFIDRFARSESPQISDIRLRFERGRYARQDAAGNLTFADVLLCELAEALSAHANGELHHARQELAQCAAVCVRAMEHVQTEMRRGAGGTP